MISGHGNNLYQYDKQVITADFSSNVAFNSHSAKILAFLSKNTECLCNYPDPLAAKLTQLIADHHGVSANRVVVTNGSTEAFYLLAHYLTNSHVGECRTAIATPSFAEYEDSCRLHSHDLTFFDLKELDSLTLSDINSVWIASPNNPNGYRWPMADICNFAAKNRECVIVLDRAYNDLSSDKEMVCELPDNIVLIESFTKLYGIPGLRLGYIVASSEIVDSLNEIRPPWSVNSLSLLAGEYIMSNLDSLQIDLDVLINESHYVQEAVDKIDGYRVLNSNCNFFLVEITNGGTAQELYDYLLKEHGMLIRNCSNFRGLGVNFFRVAVQHRSQNDKLISALAQWR